MRGVQTVKLCDVTVQIKGQNVFILDSFNDVRSKEVNNIISYLVDEGFLNSKKEISVTVKPKPLFAYVKKENKKKS